MLDFPSFSTITIVRPEMELMAVRFSNAKNSFLAYVQLTEELTDKCVNSR